VRVIDGKKSCAACKRSVPRWLGSLDDQVKKVGSGIFDASLRIEDFRGSHAEIAWIDNSATGNWPTLVMSGPLVAFLETNKVKGIFSASRQVTPRLVFSEKGESTLHPDTRVGGSRPRKKPANAAPPAARDLSFKNVPWDCANDGFVYFQLSAPGFVMIDPMTCEQSDRVFKVNHFDGPGLYRLPVRGIKAARKKNGALAVDSGAILFVDNKFLAAFLEHYEWSKATNPKGDLDIKYHNEIAALIGSRFGICSSPPSRFKSEFKGDGFYTVNAAAVIKA
jgi:hypothetical protein